MKKYNIILLLLVGYCSIYSSCKGDLGTYSLSKYTIAIQNNSNDTLIYAYSTSYPDTSIPVLPNDSLIYPNQKQNIYIAKYLFPNYPIEGILEFFLFNKDTLQKYSKNVIVSKYLVAKRYDLTFDSLSKMNNTIIYP